MKQKSTVPIMDDEVKWLVIETDEEDTGGSFLYSYKADNTAYDTWHKTLDDAFEAAYMQYNVTRED